MIIYRWKQHEQHEIMQNCSLLVAHERDEIRKKLPELYVTFRTRYLNVQICQIVKTETGWYVEVCRTA
jgi:hypothetical protein